MTPEGRIVADVPAISPAVMFGAAAGVVLVVIFPLCILLLTGVRRRRHRLAAAARHRRYIVSAASLFLAGRDRSAGRILREHLDDHRTRVRTLDALATVISRNAVDAVLLSNLAEESAAADWLALELESNETDRMTTALEFAREFRMVSLDAHIGLLLGHPDGSVRKAAHRALVAVDPTSALVELLRRTDAGEPWADALVLDALAALPPTGVSRAIARRVPAVVGPQSADAIDLADDVECARVVTSLVAALEHSSDYMRLLTIRSLGFIDHPSAIGVLFGAMHSDLPLLRSAAAAALVGTARGRALLDGVASDPRSASHVLARSVLTAFDGRVLTEPLVIDLRDLRSEPARTHPASTPLLAAR